MYRRKRRDYQRYLREMEVVQGIAYRPFVWSTWGRAHPEAQVMLRALSVQAARRHGLRDHSLLLRRTRAAIGVQLMCRAVRMLRACTPFLREAEERMLFSELEGNSFEWPRQRVVRLMAGESDAR